jgi:hypothetical protein
MSAPIARLVAVLKNVVLFVVVYSISLLVIAAVAR